MAKVEVITYKGIRFRRYPDASRWPERAYYTPGIADRQKGVKRLHEEIWMDANGPIPEGCHIHHADHDPLNNDPGNLVCLTEAEHAEEHRESASERSRTPEALAHLDKIRPLTIEWHRSEEGRAWHREHGKEAWQKREALDAICDQCGKPFGAITRRDSERFCSNACKSAWRRAAGLDDVDRLCHWCGRTFRINKYSKSTHCSKSCGRSCSWKGGCPHPGRRARKPARQEQLNLEERVS